MNKVNNPRFPHHCTVYRIEGETSFSEGQRMEILNSKCRLYLNTSTTSNGVCISKWVVSLPKHGMNIGAGDEIEVTANGRTLTASIVEAVENNLGANIYFNDTKN